MNTQKIGNLILLILITIVWAINTFINFNIVAFIILSGMMAVGILNCKNDFKRKR